MYENFSAPSTESLDSMFNRLQKILNQLAILEKRYPFTPATITEMLNRMKSSTSASRSQPSGNTKNNMILQTTSSNMKNKVEDQSRSIKSNSNKKNRVSELIYNANVKHTMLNANFELIFVKRNQWTIRTLLWRNTSGSRKKKLENLGKRLTGKLLSMVESGFGNDNEKVNMPLFPSAEPTIFRSNWGGYKVERYTGFRLWTFRLGGSKRQMSWRQFIVALRLHTKEDMESLDFSWYWRISLDSSYGPLEAFHSYQILPELPTSHTLRLAYRTRGKLDAGLMVPAPSQPSRTSSSQTHDPPILIFCFYLLYIYYSCLDVSKFETGPHERNIDEYWWRIYTSGDVKVLES
nr:hypothetical protein [Tanacetum cinerariifolium]